MDKRTYKTKLRGSLRGNSYWRSYLYHREIGHYSGLGYKDSLMRDVYNAMVPTLSWDPFKSLDHTHHGAVFNLEFSPDGTILVAACERRSILMVDPLTSKLIGHVDQAHTDCVNCIKFLDSRMFATCSDDTTVALWDTRYLKQKIRSLKGHSNWVKNIEYCSRLGHLVTSGFDGSIYTWEINRYVEGEVPFQRVFHTDGLMRTRLTSDGGKLVVCTTGGYLMIVHDLDLTTISSDLHGFKPNMYRLMQLSSTPIPLGYNYNHLFTAKRNRVQLISDFPAGNEAEVISSLQVHPQGWCVLSRNTSSDENSEWTCVHDIQDYEVPEPVEEDELEKMSAPSPPSEPSSNSSNPSPSRPIVHIRFRCPHHGAQPLPERPQDDSDENIAEGASGQRIGGASSSSAEGASGLRIGGASSSSAGRASVNNIGDDNIFGSNDTPGSSRPSIEVRISSPEVLEALATTYADIDPPNRLEIPEELSSRSQEEDSNSPAFNSRERPSFFIRTGSQQTSRTLLLLGPNRAQIATRKKHKIYQNPPRLTHYVEEPNEGRGFIKELCFSADGRLVCSPFGKGIRLLSFNPQVSELCDSVPESPVKLYELASNITHSNVVVSTKFSPTHYLLASGCLSGKICFHQPVVS